MALITPADIPTGTVTGTFYFVTEDSVDADTSPELTVVTGSVVFTPVTHDGQVIQRLQLIGKFATAIPQQFNAKFNGNGELVPMNGTGVGLKIPASSAPEWNPSGWKWRVEYNLLYAGTNRTVNLPVQYITVDKGQTVDLTAAMPIVETETVLTVRGPQGPTGDSGVHIGPTPPADTTRLWIQL